MQTTQKRQEDDVKVHRPSGPLHFGDAPSAVPGQQFAHRGFEPGMAQGYTPFQQLPYAAPQQLAYGSPIQWVPTPNGQSLVPALPWGAPQVGFQQAGFGVPSLAFPQAQVPSTPINSQGIAQRVPACDIVDEGGEYVCQIELPGVKRENVDVSSFERAILVTAHAEPDIDVGALVLAERGTTTSFRRTINLPSEVQPANAKATLRDGILTINLPKAKPTAGAKRIPVA